MSRYRAFALMFLVFVAFSSMPTQATTIFATQLTGTPAQGLYAFDSGTPSARRLINPNTFSDFTYALGFDATGASLYAVATPGTLGRIDPTTGTQTLLGAIAGITGTNIVGLCADPTSGKIYLLGYNGFTDGGVLYTLDPATMVASVVGVQSAPLALVDLAIDASGQLFSVSDNNDSLYRLDKSTGQASQVGALGLDILGQESLAFDRTSGTLYAVLGQRDLANYQFGVIDPRSGAFTAQAAFGTSWKIAIAAAPVPEPSTPTMMAFGLLSAIVASSVRRRRGF